MARASGMSVLELLAVLAIAVLIAALAVPSMTRLHQQQQSAAGLQQLSRAIAYTRHAAISYASPVTLCPSADRQRCAGRDEWHLGAIAFADRDRSGQREAGEALLRAFPPLPEGTRVYWRSFGNRSYLRMMPAGLTHWQNGHFLYCPPGQDAELARSLIVSASGRVRRARDASGSPIAVDGSGRPLDCPETG